MRITYQIHNPIDGQWYGVDLAAYCDTIILAEHKRVTLHLAPDEWSRINHGTHVTLSDTVTRLATKWRIGEGEAARHVLDVIGALQSDRLADLVDSHNNPDRLWSAGYSNGYQDGRRDGIATALVNLKNARDEADATDTPGLARAVAIVEACKK